eukprot:jgi/Galph1/2312/GphlegSOOS_G990.1
MGCQGFVIQLDIQKNNYSNRQYGRLLHSLMDTSCRNYNVGCCDCKRRFLISHRRHTLTPIPKYQQRKTPHVFYWKAIVDPNRQQSTSNALVNESADSLGSIQSTTDAPFVIIAEICLRVALVYHSFPYLLNEESGYSDTVQSFRENPHRIGAFLAAIRKTLGDRFLAATFFLGSDGRYFAKEALLRMIYSCIGYGNVALIIAKNGLVSVPAASCAIIKYACEGGFMFSVNKKETQHSFGIQYFLGNGGPMRDIFLERLIPQLDKITEYRMAGVEPEIDITSEREYFIDDHRHYVSIIDPLELYVDELKKFISFQSIREFLHEYPQFLLIDTMHTLMGTYAHRIFSHYDEHFGGWVPDPCIENVPHLIERVRASPNKTQDRLGVAFDNEGRTCLLVTPKGMISNQDSLAVMLTYLSQVLISPEKFRGVGKPFVASRAIDQITDALDLSIYESACGWRYLCNLMDREKVDLCMDERGGIGVNWIRERDAIWVVLAWLNIIAWKNKNSQISSSTTLQDVQDVMEEHWKQYGRYYHACYEYIAKDDDQRQQMVQWMQSFQEQSSQSNYEFLHTTIEQWLGKSITKDDLQIENYGLYNPFEAKSYERLAVCIVFDNYRIVVRLDRGNYAMEETSWQTGESFHQWVQSVQGLYMYLEKYEPNHPSFQKTSHPNANDTETVLQPLWQLTKDLLQWEQYWKTTTHQEDASLVPRFRIY